MIRETYKKILTHLVHTAVATASMATVATALPNGPAEFCEVYGGSPLCKTAQPDCSLCHTSAPARNGYGDCIHKALNGASFTDAVGTALRSIEAQDCDGDGATNETEIFAGTYPGLATSKPKAPAKPAAPACEDDSAEGGYNLCGYDYVFAFRKVYYDFCRRPASYDELKTFKQLQGDERKDGIRTALQTCMTTEPWIAKDGVVWRMAYDKIGANNTTKSGANQGTIPLGDYEDDFNLWVYYQTGGRDVRGLLTADHYVMRQDNPTSFEEVDDVPLYPGSAGFPAIVAALQSVDTQQFIARDKRAGLLTTTWALATRTMFTSTPRTAAAQALRAFLGIDIAKSEGLQELYPKDPNFKLQDYDNKGVTAADCAFCHQALDPVTYPFTKYNGLSFNFPSSGGGGGTTISLNDPGVADSIRAIPKFLLDLMLQQPDFLSPLTYDEDRLKILAKVNKDTEPNLASTPTAGYLFGQPVSDLPTWARAAADSDAFAQNVVRDYWKLLLGRTPSDKEQATFKTLWQNLRTKHNYSVASMLEELVATEVYGAP